MGKHTAGPLTLERGRDGGFTIRDAQGSVLCQRPAWPSRAAESLANGHLFAAAPDLLDVARQVAERGVAAGGMAADDDAIEEMARRAIAKAEGADPCQ